MKVNFILINKNNFSKACSIYLYNKIIKAKNILIPGGNSIKKIYSYLSKLDKFKKKCFYLTDERITLNKKETNSSMINNLFIKKKKIDLKLFNHKFSSNDKIISNYRPIPKKFDLSILSFGVDGHIASIFFDNRKVEKFKKFEITKHKAIKRISISRNVLKNSKNIQIICATYKRGILLKKNFLKNKGIFYLFKDNLTIVFNKEAFQGFIK